METTPKPRRQGWIWAVALIALAFAAGAAWQYVDASAARARATELATRLYATEAQLALTRATARLGVAVMLAQSGEYEAARRTASRFFSELQEYETEGPPPPPAFAAALSRRDDLITRLSRAEPGIGQDLAQLLSELGSALGMTDLAAPAGGPLETPVVDPSTEEEGGETAVGDTMGSGGALEDSA